MYAQDHILNTYNLPYNNTCLFELYDDRACDRICGQKGSNN